MKMKIKYGKIHVAAWMMVLGQVVAFAATNELSTMLSKGLFEEEANHNLSAAIQVYQAVIDRFDKDRKLAATAVFRLGECYRKQGNTNEALVQFDRVPREFADQVPLASLSRQYLASLGGPVRTETGVNQASSPGGSSENAINVVDVGETSRVLAIIKNSPDLINAPDRSGQTLLQTYAAKGELDVVKLLLDNGAAANGTRQADLTPLHFAAGNGHKSVVDLLLSKGAKADVRTEAGVTPLHLAVWQGYELVAKDLMEGGASVNAAVNRLSSRSGVTLSFSFHPGQTPLHLACLKGYVRLVQELIVKGADVNAEDAEFRTPLGIAAQAQSTEMAKTLLAAHADPNKGRPSALNIAAGDGDISMLQLLLASGGDPNAGQPTPLQAAIANNHPETVRELLSHKGDPSAKDANGVPLIFEALHHEAILQVMLEGGANANVTNSASESPLLAVLKHNFTNYTQLVRTVLSRGADPNAADPSGMTPLHAAAIFGRPSVIDPLIEHGANINAQRNGETPLNIAVRNAAPEIVAALLEHGADPNVRDNSGETPLDTVKRMQLAPRFPGGPPMSTLSAVSTIQEMLLTHGADANLPRMDTIEVRRAPSYASTVFTRYTNDLNRFTVLELVAVHYGFVYASPWRQTSTPEYDSFSRTIRPSLPFPSLDKIIIKRPESGGKSWTAIPVDVQGILDSGDCSRDVWLKWGDRVEIPEADHPLNDHWRGFSGATFTNLQNCLKREVLVTVKGQATEFTLEALQPGGPPSISWGTSFNYSPPKFCLALALQDSGLLRASSDISRVKVTRHSSKTGENWEKSFDCSGTTPYPSLLLRDGDAIDVPEKP